MYNRNNRPIATGFHTVAKQAITDALKMSTTLYELGDGYTSRHPPIDKTDASRYGFELLELTETEKVLVLDAIETHNPITPTADVRISKVEEALRRLGYTFTMMTTEPSSNTFIFVKFRPNIEMLDNIRKYKSILNIECAESFEKMIDGWRFESSINKVS